VKFELYIDNDTTGKTLQQPTVVEGMTWTTERKGAAGKLVFTVVKDKNADFQEGNPVRLTVNGTKVFYGFVFTKKRGKEQQIEVTAYDQLRYLQNKDTYVYSNKTASDVISMLAADFDLQLGTIEQTAFTIASRTEDNASLFDIILNALDLELSNKKNMFVLYDDFGKLTLKSIGNMKVPILIDAETAENFDYSSTIDDNTYNRIRLYPNGGGNPIEVSSDTTISKWGVLQYSDSFKSENGENGQAKAEALLSLYNAKTRKLKISKAFGDLRVRAGSLIVVKLSLGDTNVQNYMLVEKCVHTFNESQHYMDLTLRGGEFVG
jgi:hypothetical protein